MDRDRRSELVHAVLCRIVGTSEIVAMRREILDFCEFLSGPDVLFGLQQTVNIAGSEGEGFRLRESDIDGMISIDNIKVIWNDYERNEFSEHLLWVFDGSNSPPGYGLLYKSTSQNEDVLPMMHRDKNGKVYVTSSDWKNTLYSLQPNTWIHGPCLTFKFESKVVDNAICLGSNSWPPIASSFKNRSDHWPMSHICHQIVRNGCHVVPIGSIRSHLSEDEWRISFSKAEKTLVCNMTHCQFLLYGLMKFFLKEVINKNLEENDELLCSYHMKTAVFWALQQNSLPECCPRNLLNCFWICFKLVIKWVYEGVCPNFFIPENNMFLAKIYGPSQRKLFFKLYEMYEIGLSCLFKSPSIQRLLSVNHLTQEITISRESEQNTNVKELLFGLEKSIILIPFMFNEHTFFRTLGSILKLVDSKLTPIQAFIVQKTTVSLFNHLAFYLLSLGLDNENFCDLAEKASCVALKLSIKFGGISDILFCAMFQYRKQRYQKALALVNTVEKVLKQLKMIPYFQKVSGNRGRLTTRQIEWYSAVFMKTYPFSIKLYSSITYIDELNMQQEQSSRYSNAGLFTEEVEQILKYFRGGLLLAPSVFKEMLKFLCYWHIDVQKSRVILNEFAHLLKWNDLHIANISSGRNIAWHILGICQEISGNNQEALFAYRKSLDEIHVHNFVPINNIRLTTLHKIQCMERQMPNNMLMTFRKKLSSFCINYKDLEYCSFLA